MLTSAELCARFAAFCRDAFDCHLAAIWSYDPLNNHLVLLAAEGAPKGELDPPIMNARKGLSGKTVDRRRVTVFTDLSAPDERGRRFHHPALRQKYGLRSMISLPVLCTSNPNQVMLVLNLFPRTLDAIPVEQECEIPPGTGFDVLSIVLAQMYERCLRNQGIRLASRLNLRLAKIPKELPNGQCEEFSKVLREALKCDTTMLYLEDPGRNHLTLRASVGTVLPQPIESRIRSDIAPDVWIRNREMLIHSLRDYVTLQRRSIRRAFENEDMLCALIPVRDLAGRAQGTVFCSNLSSATGPGTLRPFTYEDVGIVEAISEAFAPHLAVILADQQRDDLLSKVAHELRVPLVALRAALERIEMESQTKGWVFRYPYFRELNNYALLMSMLLKNLDTVRKGAHFIPLEPAPTRIVPAIIAPAKRFVTPLLRQRSFREDQIRYFNMDDMPALYLDTLLMMQVVFNLLENAIKYYRGQPSKFRLEIEGKNELDVISIIFRDWGIGVPQHDSQEIFDAGFRADNAVHSRVPGDGLGLWMARDIVQRHGGCIKLARNLQPTEFVIELPSSLQNRPPKLYEQNPTN